MNVIQIIVARFSFQIERCNAKVPIDNSAVIVFHDHNRDQSLISQFILHIYIIVAFNSIWNQYNGNLVAIVFMEKPTQPTFVFGRILYYFIYFVLIISIPDLYLIFLVIAL